jgi:hypothetical protein
MHTTLENKVIAEQENYLATSDSDLYMICKNIYKHHGEEATLEQIAEEVELFYNN